MAEPNTTPHDHRLTALLQPPATVLIENESVVRMAQADQFFAAVLDAMRRIQLSDGSAVTVTAVETAYVVHGHEYRVGFPDGGYFLFWVGLNGTRLHFAAALDVDEAEAEKSLDVVTHERKLDGWMIQLNPAIIEDGMRGCAIKARVLMAERTVDREGNLTDSGLTWAVEVANLAQDLVRDCDSFDIGQHPLLVPAPHN